MQVSLSHRTGQIHLSRAFAGLGIRGGDRLVGALTSVRAGEASGRRARPLAING